MNSNRWIFIRGLTRGNIHWSRFPEVFKKLNPDAEMEFLEIPGNGQLVSESTPVNPEELIELLRSKSSFVKNKQKFNLCGISLGGMACMKWTELYPAEVESISIINSSLNQYSAFDERLMVQNYETLLRAIFMDDPLLQEETVLRITSNKFEETKINLPAFAEFLHQHQITKMNFLRQLLLAKNIFIESIPLIPFKVIVSETDRLVDCNCSKRIAERLGGELFSHPTAGHDLPLDEPEWLSEILIENLD